MNEERTRTCLRMNYLILDVKELSGSSVRQHNETAKESRQHAADADEVFKRVDCEGPEAACSKASLASSL